MALTEYRFVILFVRRRFIDVVEPEGEGREEFEVDMVIVVILV